VLDAVGALVRAHVNRPHSMREGEFQAGGVLVSVVKVLVDTGALHKSYISADLVERYRDLWSSCNFPHRAVACLADQVTKKETNEIVRVTLSFVTDDGSTEYNGQVKAILSNMPGMDFILGLPDITRNFVHLLTSMSRVTTNEVSSVELEAKMRPGEIIMQWSTGEVEESSEEEDTPIPVAFGPV